MRYREAWSASDQLNRVSVCSGAGPPGLEPPCTNRSGTVERRARGVERACGERRDDDRTGLAEDALGPWSDEDGRSIS
jgi:hypothetical protein